MTRTAIIESGYISQRSNNMLFDGHILTTVYNAYGVSDEDVDRLGGIADCVLEEHDYLGEVIALYFDNYTSRFIMSLDEYKFYDKPVITLDDYLEFRNTEAYKVMYENNETKEIYTIIEKLGTADEALQLYLKLN
jgi:uncharacterized membrane protein YheB (UPF0754 family)